MGWEGGERWGLGLGQSVMEKLGGGTGAGPGGLRAAGDLFGSSKSVSRLIMRCLGAAAGSELNPKPFLQQDL